MADTLSSFSESMALLPDNTSRLIDPRDHRVAAISLMADRGAAFADPAAGPWVIPIATQNVWVDIPQAITADMLLGESIFWRMDANGHLVYDYTADWPTIDVPPGHTRQVRLQAVLDIDPNSDTLEFAFAIAGVIQLPSATIDTANQTNAVSVTLLTTEPVDVSAGPPVSVQVRNTSNADDLVMNAFLMDTEGGPLA